ncbi:uncharacterized protein N7479_004361 [Penicillium vulpinum]|uniref:Zn(2)-C6 fungal-type domain-containing protein n=1 Tax=Penicillium vulpinum TaxID=29845 RepID=A0A1V6SCA6_9EURO|nr:uncharacterized protein N7479_004361 [Penicillium vulpinum]KAJ5964485.1 hypothetical protein N7479_004361 [Penicillium vulpinum]OQE11354.1 hypothetical protein PENVUL_c002G09039 [Penicillium vulpinum]
MSDVNVQTKGRRQQNGLACEECRSRKLKCDMAEPHCGTCYNLGVTCITNPLRRPRGPRKGHVKTLKSRIAILERQLYGDSEAHPDTPEHKVDNGECRPLERDKSAEGDISDGAIEDVEAITSHGSGDYMEYLMSAQPIEISKWPGNMSLDFESELDQQIDAFNDHTALSSAPPLMTNLKPTSGPVLENSVIFPDLSPKPLPIPPLVTQPPIQITPLECADLDDLFFERAYLFAPIIHQQHYFARAARVSRMSEPFSCLQHAMRTLAASMGSQFKAILPMLYTRTSGMLDAWDHNTPDEAIPIEIVQAQLLLALYRILKEDPRKGWSSAGHCFHLVHRAKLDQIDSPRIRRLCQLSEVEIEERRRTFWTAYALDRYANLVHELPLALNDQMILTRLPATEAAFQRQGAIKTEFLASAMSQKTKQPLSPYAKSMVIVTILARCLAHRNQCNVERITDPTSQEYLTRHRALDKILTQEIETTLSNISTELEPYNPTRLYIEMIAEAAILVLFTALSSVPEGAQDVYRGYEKRACEAAERIHTQAQRLSQLGFFKVHPFTPIALFICAGFTRSCKSVNANATEQFKDISSSLRYLASANSLAGMFHFELQQSGWNRVETGGL